MKLLNNSSFVILIFAILKFRNIGRSLQYEKNLKKNSSTLKMSRKLELRNKNAEKLLNLTKETKFQ